MSGFECCPYECPEAECEAKEERRQKIILLRPKLCKEDVDEEPNCTRRAEVRTEAGELAAAEIP